MNDLTIEKLCQLAKKKCRITWSDEFTDEKVRNMVENTVLSLKHKLGIVNQEEEVFLSPGMTRTLFENYCMYDWNDMIEEFSKNYREEIIGERHKYEVENAKKESEELQ